MGLKNYSACAIIVSATALTLSGCNDSSTNKNTEQVSSSLSEAQKANQSIKLSMFKQEAFITEPKIVDCETQQVLKQPVMSLLHQVHLQAETLAHFALAAQQTELMYQVLGLINKVKES
ncbi:hypothetical protein [Pseudoalteromonas sp. NGC95]|uniref:hypothetical protein n=1 Tax=Pseudoalteromonas sp. NGC95 TaxID=2792051 RepID=UPI001E4AF8B6|nr:hypothetical protein [Pseudoalteromonas sp. NGC95]